MSLSWKIKNVWCNKESIKKYMEVLDRYFKMFHKVALDNKYTDNQFNFAMKKYDDKVNAFYEKYPMLKEWKLEYIKLALN